MISGPGTVINYPPRVSQPGDPTGAGGAWRILATSTFRFAGSPHDCAHPPNSVFVCQSKSLVRAVERAGLRNTKPMRNAPSLFVCVDPAAPGGRAGASEQTRDDITRDIHASSPMTERSACFSKCILLSRACGRLRANSPGLDPCGCGRGRGTRGRIAARCGASCI